MGLSKRLRRSVTGRHYVKIGFSRGDQTDTDSDTTRCGASTNQDTFGNPLPVIVAFDAAHFIEANNVPGGVKLNWMTEKNTESSSDLRLYRIQPLTT